MNNLYESHFHIMKDLKDLKVSNNVNHLSLMTPNLFLNHSKTSLDKHLCYNVCN